MMGHEDVHKAEEVGKWKGDPFIITYMGKEFNYNHITEDSIDIRDIAHSLSHLCRYTGHTNLFYSVAQHSLLVSEMIQGGPEVKLTALLHDAAEAYTNDLASPLKAWMNQASHDWFFDRSVDVYFTLQDTITAAVYDKYGIKEIHENIRLYDLAAGMFEAEAFMGLTEMDLVKYNFPTHLRELWNPWLPIPYAAIEGDRDFGDVNTQFLKRFEDLMALLGRQDNDE